MKRFYKDVTVRPSLSGAGFEVLLDSKNIKTKKGLVLNAPSEDIANAVAEEWRAQVNEILPQTMPLTQILNTRMDRVEYERAAITQYLLKYLDTDLLCYRVAEPEDLAAHQEKIWSPYLTFFEDFFHIKLALTTDLFALTQNVDAHEKLKNYVTALDHDRFTILQIITALAGSIILGVCFLEKFQDAEDLIGAIYLEEFFREQFYNIEKYGRDPIFEKTLKNSNSDIVSAIFYRDHLSA